MGKYLFDNSIGTKPRKHLGGWLVAVVLLHMGVCPVNALPLYSKDIECGNCYVDITKTLSQEIHAAHCPVGDAYNDPVTHVRNYNLYYCECRITDLASSTTNLVLNDLADLPVRQHNYPHNCPHHFLWQELIYYNNGTWLWADSWNYLLVTTVGANAFKGRTKLQHVRLPDTCRTIGTNAFNGCTALTSIELQEGLESIGDYAFANCTSLTNIVIPNSVTNIGYNAFRGCTALTSVTVPQSVCSSDSWGQSVFRSLFPDSPIAHITIGTGVTSIGEKAFRDCKDLTSVTIPSTVTDIGNSAFYGCGLTAVTIPASVTSIGDYAFEGCSDLTLLTISDGVTHIGASAFEGCSSLPSVTIPSSVTSIGQYAFAGCDGLEAVHIHDLAAWCRISFEEDSNPLAWAHRLFVNGMEVTDLVIPAGITSIGNYAFEGGSELASVTIPDSVANIGEWAFYGCGLETVTIPGNVENIGMWAFGNCHSLSSVTIPGSVTSIGECAFEGCDGLEAVHIHDLAAWCRISFEEDSNPLEWAHRLFLDGREVTALVLPDSTTSIGDYAFCGCSGLASVTIPASVASIGEGAFSGCSGLDQILVEAGNPSYASADGVLFDKDMTTLLACPSGKTGAYVIPDSVESIDAEAFRNCVGLSSLTIPPGVTDLGSVGFAGCSSLASLQVAPGNPSYASVDGVLFDKEMKTLILCPVGKEGAYDLPSGVETIGERAFLDCTGLTSVVISYGVTGIGDWAFCGCTGLTSVKIPDSVTEIGWEAFEFCSGLASITIPDSVTWITPSMFWGSGLTSLTIPDGVTEIGEYAFYDCTNLTTVTIPDSVTYIGWYVFGGCSSLKTLYVPASWEGTGNLDEAEVPDSCTVVYGGAPEAEETTSTPVAVAYSWLEANAPTILAEHANDYESAAKATAANGRPVWECYVADISPTDATDFKTTLAFENGQWLPKPLPDRSSTRTYDIEGTDRLGPDTVWGPTNSSTRFFRLRVRLP